MSARQSPGWLGRQVTTVGLILLVPVLILAVLGLFTGSLALGVPELVLLGVCWLAGLSYVYGWRPRH